jgi:hypothetical protein
MTPLPKIDLSIQKRTSAPLDGAVLLEYIPIKRVKALIKSDLLRIDWVPNRSGVLKEYANEKEQLKQYLKLYNHHTKSFRVKYIKPKHKWGRILVKEALGCTALNKATRNTLIDGLYYDFDLKNAQPEIIRNICVANHIDCPEVIEYCNNRTEILEKISSTMGVDIKHAKKLMLRLCFFGTFQGFCEENNLRGVAEPAFVSAFTRRLMKIAEETKLKNTELYNTARKQKEAKDEKNFIGSFYAYFLQEYEFRIVERVMTYLMHETTIMDHPYIQTAEKVGIYEYDGIKLLKENVDKFGYENVLKLINEKTIELTGFKLCWEEKPIDKVMDISKWIELVVDNNKPDTELFEICEMITKKFDDTGVIETIAEIYPNNFVFSNKVWYSWNGSKWEEGDGPLRLAITYGVSKHWFSLIAPFEQQYPQVSIDDEGFNVNCERIKSIKADIDKFTKQHLHDNTQIGKCVGQGKTLLCDDSIEFDCNPDLFGCNNGVLDLKEGVFRPARFNDYITWSCGYNFTPCLKGIRYMEFDENSGENVIHTVVENNDQNGYFDDIAVVMGQIFPDDEIRQLMLFILSTGLSGVAIEKFFVFNGAGRNGKGVLNEFMKSILGKYFSYVSPLVITENQKKKSSSQANPEIAKLDRIRYIIMKEPPENQLIQNSQVKDMTGGGELQARECHSNKTRVRLHCTVGMEVNVKLNFAENPKDADAERIVDILFGSFFTDDSSIHDPEKHIYPLNANLKTDEWRFSHRNAMLNLLFSYQLRFRNEGKGIIDRYIPASVKNRTMEYLQNSYDIHNIFTTYFEIPVSESNGETSSEDSAEDDPDWTLAKISQFIRASAEFRELPKLKQKEYNPEYIKSFFRKNAIYKKTYKLDSHSKLEFLRGWRLKGKEG